MLTKRQEKKSRECKLGSSKNMINFDKNGQNVRFQCVSVYAMVAVVVVGPSHDHTPPNHDFDPGWYQIETRENVFEPSYRILNPDFAMKRVLWALSSKLYVSDLC